MIRFVYGGSGSGKSSFAEQLVVSSGAERKYYVATMKVYDDEGRRKVERHQKLREDKGFVTIEQPTNIGVVAERLRFDSTEQILQNVRPGEETTGKTSEKSVVLLECVMNLVANEMFTPEGIVCEESAVIERVKSGLTELFSVADDIVVVSGNVFCDGVEYDETTQSYMRALAAVNAFVARKADESFEVVAGIPLRIGSAESAA